MTQKKTITLDCPECGGPLEVVHSQASGSDVGVVQCQKCHREFGTWDAFKKAFIDPKMGESQDRLRRDGGHHHHHR